MTYEFFPGERARILNTSAEYAEYRGSIVRVLTPVLCINTRYGRMAVHEVRIENPRPEHKSDIFVVPPQLLQPIDGPGDWDTIRDACDWDPRTPA